jgi:hypothetical protein
MRKTLGFILGLVAVPVLAATPALPSSNVRGDLDVSAFLASLNPSATAMATFRCACPDNPDIFCEGDRPCTIGVNKATGKYVINCFNPGPIDCP